MLDNNFVFVGCCKVGLLILEELINFNLKPKFIVGISEESARINKVSGYFNYEFIANKNNIPYYCAKRYDLKDKFDIEFFKINKFDLLIQGGWQRLFPEEIINTLKIGAIGGHGSSEFLPYGRGRSPINWSLIEGKKRFIMHQFLIKPGIDDGDIFDYQIFDINEYDDCKTLYYKNAIVTKNMLLKNIPKLLDGTIELREQIGEVFYYPKRTEEDGKIDFSKTVFEINNFIRALTNPYPGAFALVNKVKIIIWKAQVFDTRISYPNSDVGEIIEIFDNNLVVNCYSGLLLITDYQGKVKKGDILY